MGIADVDFMSYCFLADTNILKYFDSNKEETGECLLLLGFFIFSQ